MTQANPLGLVEEDGDIERTLHQRCRESVAYQTPFEIEIEDKESSVMSESRRILSEYGKVQNGRDEFIVQALIVTANNFEIKANTIRMIQNIVQFDGLADEDLNVYLSWFL